LVCLICDSGAELLHWSKTTDMKLQSDLSEQLFVLAYVRFSNRVSLSSSVFPSFGVITARVTLLYLVGFAVE
jgi:hypothetical protein